MNFFTMNEESGMNKLFPGCRTETASLMVYMPFRASLFLKIGESGDLVLGIRKNLFTGSLSACSG